MCVRVSIYKHFLWIFQQFVTFRRKSRLGLIIPKVLENLVLYLYTNFCPISVNSLLSYICMLTHVLYVYTHSSPISVYLLTPLLYLYTYSLFSYICNAHSCSIYVCLLMSFIIVYSPLSYICILSPVLYLYSQFCLYLYDHSCSLCVNSLLFYIFTPVFSYWALLCPPL